MQVHDKYKYLSDYGMYCLINHVTKENLKYLLKKKGKDYRFDDMRDIVKATLEETFQILPNATK
jgi:hypothetical protein